MRPTLLLAHALGTDRSLWDGLVPYMGDYDVLTYDALGHGARPATAPCTIADLGRDALAVLDAHGVERATFCGVSLGGLTGLWLGIHAPERLAGLVVASATARIGTAETWAARIALVEEAGMAAVAAASPARWFTNAFLASQPDVVARTQALVARTDPAGYINACGALRDADLTNEVGRIAVPTRVLAGREDPVTTAVDQRALAEAIPGARYVELAGSHLPHLEDPAAFATMAGLRPPKELP